jgi:hypothetical protein
MPFEPQNAIQHFAVQHMNATDERVRVIQEARSRASGIGRSVNERFYYNLALFSAGTIALSVTYLGYLKNAFKAYPAFRMADDKLDFAYGVHGKCALVATCVWVLHSFRLRKRICRRLER